MVHEETIHIKSQERTIQRGQETVSGLPTEMGTLPVPTWQMDTHPTPSTLMKYSECSLREQRVVSPELGTDVV